MRGERLDREILSILNLHERVDLAHEDRQRERWTAFVRKLTAKKDLTVNVGVAGKYANLRDAYASIDKALEHCSAHLGCVVDLHWLETTDLTEANAASALHGLDAVIVPGGFGNRGVEGKIACVRHCRENAVPYLGICLGFQVAVIEFARNVLGLHGANSTEFDLRTPHPVISELPEQKKIEGLGGTMRLGGQEVLVEHASLAAKLYDNASRVRERFRHRYEVEPAYIDRLVAGGLVFSGRHPTRPIMQILELRQSGGFSGGAVRASAGAALEATTPGVTHPYFIGAQFHPELTSRPLKPQPMFYGLVQAALERRYASRKNERRGAVTS
jgi:CTP synthase